MIWEKFVLPLMLVGLISSAQAAVTPYPRVPGDEPNPDYPSVKVNGVPVDTVATDMKVGYAHFAFAGTVKVEITAKDPIQTFDLSPHRLGIAAKADGRVLCFELSEPRKLHLRINGLSRFFLFADAPEADPPQPGRPGVRSLSDQGVSSSPELVQTVKIQQAIDEAASNNEILYIPPGIYRTGSLEVKGRLYLAPGAILKGTGRVSDYPKGRFGAHQIRILNSDNVKIFGRGIIDGHGITLRRNAGNSMESRARLITSVGSRNLVLEDILLRESPVWCVHLIESSDIRASNLKLISLTRAEAEGEEPFLGSNTDGFDPDNSSRILIENNFISVDDDAIAVKLTRGKRRDMEDIQFRGNVIWIMCSALKIGTEIHEHTVSNVTFENNDIVHADVGIAVWCWRGGTVRDARWINNYFEGIGTVKKDSPHKKETNIRVTIRNVNNDGAGHVRNLLIKDNTYERFSPNDSLLQGFDAEHLVDGVVIDNLVIDGKKRTDPDDARLTVGRFVKNWKLE